MCPETTNQWSETPPSRFRKLRFGLIIVFALIAVVSVVVYYWSGYMPGTLQTRVEGVRIEAWGTGTLKNYYRSGALQSRHSCRAGRHLKSEWYKPDGDQTAYVVRGKVAMPPTPNFVFACSEIDWNSRATCVSRYELVAGLRD